MAGFQIEQLSNKTLQRYCMSHFAVRRDRIMKGVDSSWVPLCWYQS